MVAGGGGLTLSVFYLIIFTFLHIKITLPFAKLPKNEPENIQ